MGGEKQTFAFIIYWRVLSFYISMIFIFSGVDGNGFSIFYYTICSVWECSRNFLNGWSPGKTSKQDFHNFQFSPIYRLNFPNHKMQLFVQFSENDENLLGFSIFNFTLGLIFNIYFIFKGLSGKVLFLLAIDF
jgi:hypothetical protein